MMRAIRRSLEIKKRVIEEDEFDLGPRNVMNYGHSFGHAIEAATNFAVPHGIAVTLGMDMANHVAWRLGAADERSFQRMHGVLAANFCGYERAPVPLDPLMGALAKDKKNLGAGTVTLILPDANGRIGKGAYPADELLRTACGEYLETVRLS
mgnify:CR=1 FL=1